jgi:hypothetical protein
MHHSFKFIRKFKLRLPNHMLYEYGSFYRRIKNFCFFITSRSYNVAFLKRYRFLHLILAVFLPLPSAFMTFALDQHILLSQCTNFHLVQLKIHSIEVPTWRGRPSWKRTIIPAFLKFESNMLFLVCVSNFIKIGS